MDRKQKFIRALAEYLVGDQASKSVQLELSGFAKQWAQEWAKVRAASPIFGYLTVDEAEAELTEFLK